MNGNDNTLQLDNILRGGHNVYVSLHDADLALLKVFTQTNAPYMRQYPGGLALFSFEVDQASPNVQTAANMLVSRGFMSQLGANGFAEAFAAIAASGDKRITLAVRNMSQRGDLVGAGKAAGLYVDLVRISDDGSLERWGTPRTDNRSNTRSFTNNPDRREGAGNAASSGNSNTPGSRSHSGDNRGGGSRSDSKAAPYEIKQQPERISISRIPVSSQLDVGSRIYDDKGTAYTLMERVLTNNGAVTYRTDVDDIWVKLYDAQSLNTLFESKVDRMLRNPVRKQGILWPIGKAVDAGHAFRGYFMHAAKGEPLHLSVLKSAGIDHYFPDWNKMDLCILTLTILDKIDYLHRLGILMGCINPAAIRVVDANTVYFTDTDNFQVEGFPSFAYNISFTPPELLGKRVYLTTLDSENFAVAELVFMIMMTGKTPYAVGVNGNSEEQIRKMQFPFPNGKVHGNAAMPGMWRFMWSHLSPIKKPLYETFQNGGKFNAQGSRKSTGFWIHCLKDFQKDLESPTDKESLKIYPRTFKRSANDEFYRCNYCGVEHPRFYFSDEYFDRYRICNDCIGKKSDVSFTCVDCGKTYYYSNRTALYHKMKKELDADWHDQKHCRDCKSKTITCKGCGKMIPYYYSSDGYCRDCNGKRVFRTVRCRYCGNPFDITYSQKEFCDRKGYNYPTKCPNCKSNGTTGGYKGGSYGNSYGNSYGSSYSGGHTGSSYSSGSNRGDSRPSSGNTGGSSSRKGFWGWFGK